MRLRKDNEKESSTGVVGNDWVHHHNNFNTTYSFHLAPVFGKKETRFFFPSSYSSVLHPCEFFLFPKLQMKGRIFGTIE